MDNLFEAATRGKYRFQTQKGQVNTEDLWDFNLKGLDQIARTLSKALKSSQEEESFITAKTKTNIELENKFELVKRIIKVKLQEKEHKEELILRKQQKEKLLGIIQKKKETALEELSIEELERKLGNL